MTTNSPASRNPAGNDTLSGLLRLVLDKFQQGFDDQLPAQVLAYDATANRAQVQPLIVMVTTDNIQIRRGQIASVPVFQLGAGGAVQRFAPVTGDLGWIKANDRDISLFKARYTAQPPNTQRKHSFEDAMFFPDTMLNGVTIAAEDAANAVWQNFAGTVRLALWPTLFKFTAPSVGIGDTEGYTPNPHCILDVQSTTRAFRPPVMTTGQKNAIPSPEEGMTVYDSTEKALSTFNGTTWS